MLIRLSAVAYSRIRPLFTALDYNLLIDSVLDGNTPGFVYVDQPNEPRLALLWNHQDALILASEPGTSTDPTLSHEFTELLQRVILPDARQRYIPQLSIQCYPTEWETHLPDLLANWHPEKVYRRFYLLKQIGFNYRHGLFPGYSIERMSQQLLQSNLQNRDQVIGWIESFWPSTTVFLERGFGYCVVNRYAITSWCLTVFASGNRVELGVATGEAYRKQGHASLAVAACLENSLLNDFIPEWHCWEDNLPSVKLAEKVGFEQCMSYHAYRFKTGLVYPG
jgi:RimJ/RimL family protein N-acetyltransferase